jgi:hypothetical protein
VTSAFIWEVQKYFESPMPKGFIFWLLSGEPGADVLLKLIDRTGSR